jgi:DNA mismatch endonuclease (patch repair protein)
MADVFSKRKRSEVLSRIRSRGNKDTELALAKLLRANRITGWRRQVNLIVSRRRRKETHSSKQNQVRVSSPRLLRVKPDFVFLKSRTAIFVDGCFWHGCPKHATKPANNRAFWRRKLSSNKKRDRVVNQTLRHSGWHVIRIWECDLAKHPTTCVRRIQRELANG